MPKQLPLTAYEEIKFGRLSKRQAIEKYNISQARFMRIHGLINPTPEETSWSMLERRSLTDKEKLILEQSGYTFYERHQIPKQFLELYTLILSKAPTKILDIVYLFQPGQRTGPTGDLRIIVPDYTKPQPHTGDCVDCIVHLGDVPLFIEDPSTCKCGSRDHCPNSKRCVLWKNDKDIEVMIDRPPLQVPEQIEYDTRLINIENMYDEGCFGWTLRYITLISRLAGTCQCGEKTCIFRKLAGDDICRDLKLDEPTRDYKPEKWPSLVCNNPTPGLLETTTIPQLHTCIHITSIPEGSYKCEKFAVSKLGKKTIVILILAGVGPVYSYKIQEAIKHIGGIDGLKTCKDITCELGGLCYSPTTKKKDGDREVTVYEGKKPVFPTTIKEAKAWMFKGLQPTG